MRISLTLGERTPQIVDQYFLHFSSCYTSSVRTMSDEDKLLYLKFSHVSQNRVVSKVADLLFYLLALSQNKTLFLEASGSAVLELAKKMHKKNVVLVSRLNVLLSMLT